MVNKNENNTSIIPIGSTGLVRVGNSIKIINKILKENEERSITELFKHIKIGNQEWMTKNLDVDCYANGDPIPQVQNSEKWERLKTGAWCYYNNDPSNGEKYGKLYNWYAINDERGLAPQGFKVPSMKDWKVLLNHLGDDVAGQKLKSKTGWKEEGSGTNESKLNFCPGGYRNYSTYFGINEYTHIWSSMEENEQSAFYISLNYYADNVFSTHTFKYSGFYVRCIKYENLDERNVELQDIVPLSLLYQDEITNEFQTIIEEGTPIPTSKTISINFKFQGDISIYLKLFQGNLHRTVENKVIANLVIENVFDKSKDYTKCDFTFEIDKNGILNVSIKDSTSGKFQNVKFQTFQALSANDIKELKNRANRSSI